ncbi:MAG: hypothetical protein HY921_06285 [Elusimicrobia bacterium]|nr:hypothetical protein [Elusimicrobiota bacterium]
MINFIIVTHGEFGAYLVEAAESIVGAQAEGVRAISISPRLSVPEIEERVRRAIGDLAGPDGLIIFTDMPGGTPGNIAFPLVKSLPGAGLVSGVNLYMLVSAFSRRRDTPFEALLDKVLADGKKSIMDIRLAFVAKAR